MTGLQYCCVCVARSALTGFLFESIHIPTYFPIYFYHSTSSIGIALIDNKTQFYE